MLSRMSYSKLENSTLATFEFYSQPNSVSMSAIWMKVELNQTKKTQTKKSIHWVLFWLSRVSGYEEKILQKKDVIVAKFAFQTV